MSVRVSAGSSPWESSKQPGLGIRRDDMPFASTQNHHLSWSTVGRASPASPVNPPCWKCSLQWLPAWDALLVPDYSGLTFFFFPEINGQVITYSSLFFQMPLVILWGNTHVTHGWPGVPRVSGHAWEISGCFTSVEEVTTVALERERERKKRNWVWMAMKQMPCYSGIQYIEEVVWFLSN